MNLDSWLAANNGWSLKGDRLTKCYKFASFESAMDFMARALPFISATNHHPEWKNIYNRVWVELVTHDVEKVTEKDLRLAEHLDTLI